MVVVVEEPLAELEIELGWSFLDSMAWGVKHPSSSLYPIDLDMG